MAKTCEGAGKPWKARNGNHYCPTCGRRAEMIGAARPYGGITQLHNALIKLDSQRKLM